MTAPTPRRATLATAPPTLGTYPGLDRVLRQVADLIALWRNDARVREAALSLAVAGGLKLNARTGHADMRDFDGIAAAVYRAVVRKTVYVRDPYRSELVQSPLDTLSRGMGDCDDLVVLGGSLLAAVGVPVRVVAVGYAAPTPGTRPTKTDDGGPYEHVYLETDPTGSGLWQAWDATLETKAGDVSPGIVLRRKVVDPVGKGAFGLADAPRAAQIVRVKDLGAVALAPPVRMTVTAVMPVEPPVRMGGSGLTAAQQATLVRSFRATATASGFDLALALAQHFALARSLAAAQSRFNGWLRERIAARAAAQTAYGTTGGTSGGTTSGTTGGAPSSPGGTSGDTSGSASGEARGPSKTLLLVGLAGAAALMLSGGIGGPKPTGKTVRTTKVTDENFA